MRTKELNPNTIKVDGYLFVDLFGPDGKLKDHREVKNIVTAVGMHYIVDALMGTEQDNMKWVGIGTGNAAAAATNTDLENEVGSRPAGGGTQTDGGHTYQIVETFPSGNPQTAYAIQEAGLFSTTTGGTLGARQVFATVNKAVADTLQITWKWVFS